MFKIKNVCSYPRTVCCYKCYVKEPETSMDLNEFDRPIIPLCVRKKSANRKNVIGKMNDEMQKVLKECLTQTFVFDDRMIVNGEYLCLYLRDCKGIDLGRYDDGKWDESILIHLVKQIFEPTVCSPYGYQLRIV